MTVETAINTIRICADGCREIDLLLGDCAQNQIDYCRIWDRVDGAIRAMGLLAALACELTDELHTVCDGEGVTEKELQSSAFDFLESKWASRAEIEKQLDSVFRND